MRETKMADELKSLRKQLSRNVTTDRIFTIMIAGLGTPLVLGWLLLMFTVLDLSTAGTAFAALETVWHVRQ